MPVLCGGSKAADQIDGVADFSNPLRVRLVPDSESRFNAVINESHHLNSMDLFGRGTGFTTNGLTLFSPLQGTMLQARNRGPEAEIAIEEFSQFRFGLPPTQEAQFNIDRSGALAEMVTSEGNSGLVRIDGADGARIEARAGSTVRLDVFRDQTYALSGTGSISAWNSEGQPVEITAARLPMLGGPLTKTDATAGGGLRRLNPTRKITISGTVDGEMVIHAGERVITVGGGGRQRLEFGNGGAIEFRRNLNLQTLDWSVEKGIFQFNVDSIQGWHGWGLTGQSGELQWEANLRMLDLRNTSPKGNLFVSLPSNTLVRVSPSATFQYAFMNAFTFATSATGGAVAHVNLDSSLETALDGRSQLFVAGQLRRKNEGVTGSAKTVVLNWEKGAPAELRGLLETAVIAPNTEKVIQYDETGRIALTYHEAGNLQFVALEGDYVVRLLAMNGVVVRVTEGNSVTLAMETQSGITTFRITASDLNVDSVPVFTAGGSSPELQPAQILTFTVGKDGTVVGRQDGRVVVFEPSDLTTGGTEIDDNDTITIESELPQIEQVSASETGIQR